MTKLAGPPGGGVRTGAEGTALANWFREHLAIATQQDLTSHHCAGAQLSIELPTIAVCGNQSAGKSSLLEAICDVPLPRDSGTCTRQAPPIIISDMHDVKAAAGATWQWQQQSSRQGRHPWVACRARRCPMELRLSEGEAGEAWRATIKLRKEWDDLEASHV